MAEYDELADATEYLPDYEVDSEAAEFEHATRHDGWWAVFLIFALIYGPNTARHAILPPFRSADAVILLLMALRWSKSTRFYGGFLLSYRARLFTFLMLGFTGIMVFSMVANVLTGRMSFMIKDIYTPIVYIRMVIIAAIGASFNFQEHQIKQLFKGMIGISLITVVLAYCQRFQVPGVNALVNQLYTIELKRLETLGSIKQRIGGSFGNPNVFGGCLVMLSGIILAIVISQKGIWRYLSISLYIALGAAVTLGTASRTALAGFVVVAGTVLTLSMRRGSRLPTLILMVLAFMGFMFVRAYAEDLGFSERVVDIVSGGGKLTEDAVYVRWDMWMHSLSRATESLLFGTGASKTVRQLTDNGYFYILMRMGILGLGMYLMMLLALFVRGLKSLFGERNLLKRAALLAFIMVVVNNSIFEVTGEFFSNIRYGGIFAGFMGLLCGLSYQLKEEQAALKEYDYMADYVAEDSAIVDLASSEELRQQA